MEEMSQSIEDECMQLSKLRKNSCITKQNDVYWICKNANVNEREAIPRDMAFFA
ncbi:hypothetical protein [Paenibacillus popilliae]|uniref:hypothetical protein n=1 Tax=Paenibacillus popilliae TaxID=78057 RepID=UPI0002F6FFCB|nr:hypothetical protein [Paenibacillus popilliae]